MTDDQVTPDQNKQTPAQTPVAWRIGIAVLAVVVILALLWQFLGSRAPGTQDSPEALFQLGNDYYQAKQWDQAVDAYKQAIELNPSYDAAYANLGAVYYAQQELDLAQEAYQKAISLSPNDADVIYNLGAIYLQQALKTGVPDREKLEQAMAQINKAIELNPTLAEPYYGLGVSHQLLGQNEKAIEAFEKFLDLDDGSDPTATSNATKILQDLKSGQSK